MDTDYLLAYESLQIVFGVKGLSSLHLLPSFDIPRCVPVDYMHCCLLGVAKSYASFGLNPPTVGRNGNSNTVISIYVQEIAFNIHRYIGRKADIFDSRLLQLKLPGSVVRKPRSIRQRKFWKGII